MAKLELESVQVGANYQHHSGREKRVLEASWMTEYVEARRTGHSEWPQLAVQSLSVTKDPNRNSP